jgi:phage virion morphogenesis protein
MINITVDDRAIMAALRQLQDHTANLRPALREIGETLKESTQQRFVSTISPDGAPWLRNSVLSTLSDGRKQGDRPLTNHGILGDTINYQVLGNDGVQIGSPMVYAAMMQFGGTKSEFPWLWGDIPARPFLGVSNADETDILRILQNYLESAL